MQGTEIFGCLRCETNWRAMVVSTKVLCQTIENIKLLKNSVAGYFNLQYWLRNSSCNGIKL